MVLTGSGPPTDFSITEALIPFSEQEVDRLRRYDELAEALKRSRYFAEQDKTFELLASSAGELTSKLSFRTDDETVVAMLARLRNLRDRFPPTLDLLRAHTEGRDTPSADWFRGQLDRKDQRIREIWRTSLIGLTRETEDAAGNVVTESLSAEDNFYDWMYGAYLHAEDDRLSRVRAWSVFTDVHRFNFLQMATELSRAYYGFVGYVREVLDEPALVPRVRET